MDFETRDSYFISSKIKESETKNCVEKMDSSSSVS